MDLVGNTIEKYHILQELGRGGMGVVYKAHDTELDRFVVLKMMHPNLRQQFINHFWMKVRSQAKMTHLNIVQIHDFLKTDLGFFIVMEIVDGQTLEAIKNHFEKKVQIPSMS